LRRKKILFTSSLTSTFIQEDIRLLQKHYDVTPLTTIGPVAFFSILTRIRSHDITFTWFASVYAFIVVFLGRLFGKNGIIVAGGADAAKLPEIPYGIWVSPWKTPLVRYAVRHAWRVLTVDPSLKTALAGLAGYDGNNIATVPTGFDPEKWRPGGAKERFVLTVAGCEFRWRVQVKGIDVLLEVARSCPDLHFVVVGIHEQVMQEMRTAIPPNVELIPFIAQNALLDYYQRAAVYCQPSITEGLPNSLCEAMLCECVPVGSNVGGIPTAIAGIGHVVPYGDVPAFARAIRLALDAPAGTGIRAREHIARTFTVDRREAALRQIVDEASR
jgi:glycosyltransferase involved in cell wall biosynthesis